MAGPGCQFGSGELPEWSALDADWNTLRPGGATTCANGDTYRFYARPGGSDSLLVYFEGGGACWDAATCAPGSEAFDPGIDFDPDGAGGIFDLDHPDNPLSGYAMIVIPYCTGDVHLGDRDTTYTGDSADEITIPHRGQTNAQAVLDWTYEKAPAPAQVAVMGSSAGALAVPFFADQIARQYPEARIVGLGDAAGGYRSSATLQSDPGRWGIPEVVQRQTGWQDYGSSTLGVETLYAFAARQSPNLELYQVDQAQDQAQYQYLRLAGTPDGDLPALIRANQQDILSADSTFRSYVVGGFEHMVLPRDAFYFYEAGDVRFTEWLADVLTGNPVSSVACTACSRPAYDYQPADLAMIERTMELLSSAENWDDNHEGSCPRRGSEYSLLCAMLKAVDDVGSAPPNTYAAGWDINYAASERLGVQTLAGTIAEYNNQEATRFEDIRRLLMEVRDRVQADLAAADSLDDSLSLRTPSVD
jgi:hypothetical protein